MRSGATKRILSRIVEEPFMSGLHHITAICGRAERNLAFYTHVLGLRLVKKTVNFDDPGTYHLYYGDEVGHPGTILTFFPWEYAAPGRAGLGQVEQIMFRVPASGLGYWMHRFVERGVAHEQPIKRFGETTLPFADPDGLRMALVAVAGAEAEPALNAGGIPREHAIRGFHSVVLMLEDGARTAAILTDVLGFTEIGREGSVRRLRANGGIGGIVDIHEAGGFLPGAMGRGVVHHVAFRVADDGAQAELARKVRDNHGVQTTERKDRNYFRSVYFRVPGGTLFEIATDQPGFTVDEPPALLGHALKLPHFLEQRRKEIEAVLPPLEVAA
jgi:glyoxalase family protein